MNKTFATFGEDTATQLLSSKGYTIIERNYRSPYGEIDIICSRDGELIFVEVKARRSHSFGEALEAVTENKRQKIIKTAYHYLAKKDIEMPVRFDIITLDYNKNSKDYSLRHITNAFLGEDY
ncbi:MAG: YraN family protein [Candidatus Celaenobacter antarcticus]|nr:YraN family protein [Candidatus Celaenobacter antarcticus]MDP8314641.1 YraN family protein [Candidatus Celaenobacter antarcticus]